MSYIKFDKTQLVNLEYSLSKEVIRSNRSGAYASSTITGCNTRKYHGLLIAPQPQIGGIHVLISSLDETIIHEDAAFHLGIHKFPGTYEPRGHKYLQEFKADPNPQQTYRIGSALLTKEKLLVEHENRTMVRYKLIDSSEPIQLRLSPFLAFRNIHELSKANTYVNKKYSDIKNGIKLKLYDGYNDLFMQLSKENEFVPTPDWYYNIEYLEERDRGYEYTEDLYIPGFFEITLKKNETVIFTGGPSEINPQSLTKIFNNQIKNRQIRDSLDNCLKVAASQFILKKKDAQNDDTMEVIAGYPWYGSASRDTFIALPGLTLANNDLKSFRQVLDTMVKSMNGPFFPYWTNQEIPDYECMDAPLWFFWALQKYVEMSENKNQVWRTYGKYMKKILQEYKRGTSYNIKMQPNGLLSGGEEGKALTWMDAKINGNPVTPRVGMPVEINALWYNAICFALEIAEKKTNEDKAFIDEFHALPGMIRESFLNTFWDIEKGYLADYVNEDYKDWSVRPNQVIATSLPYVPLEEWIRESVLECIKQELLTPRGLRSLSPKNIDYRGLHYGSLENRNKSYHMGSVWPWLLGHFVEGYLKIQGVGAISYIQELYDGFEETMFEHGISTISELYDGDPPFKPGGTISQAWNVAELIRIKYLLEIYKNVNEQVSV